MNDVTLPNMQNCHSLTCEVMPEETNVPRRPNEIEVKWLESKDAAAREDRGGSRSRRKV